MKILSVTLLSKLNIESEHIDAVNRMKNNAVIFLYFLQYLYKSRNKLS